MNWILLIALVMIFLTVAFWPRRRRTPARVSPPSEERVKAIVEESFEKAEADYELEWPGSPFNADVIRPGDPGWEIFQAAAKHGPVMGVYEVRVVDGEVESEIVSMQYLDDADGKWHDAKPPASEPTGWINPG